MLLPTEALNVEDSGETTAAADLGMLKTVEGRELEGGDINNIKEDTLLSWVVAGGLGVAPGPDLRITAKDGSSFELELDDAVTFGEVLEIINGETSVEAKISGEGGDSLVVVDNAGGSGDLKVESMGVSRAAEQLGLAGSTGEVVLVGERLVGDLAAVPLERVNGGEGVERGVIRITDRRGRIAELDLTDRSIETVGDVVAGINSLGNIKVSASINAGGDAIILLDTSGLPFEVFGKEFLSAHVVAAFFLVGSMVGVYILVNRPRVAGFLVEVEGELRKVSWPTRREVLGSTLVVLILMAVLAAYIFLVDFVLANILKRLF